MSKTKLNEVKVSSSVDRAAKVQVSEIAASAEPTVKEFIFQELRPASENDYAAIEAKYGPLASTHLSDSVKTQKDSRFSINPLLRESLSIEQEEKRVIDEKVQVAVKALYEESKSKAQAIGYEEGLKKGYDEAFAKFVEDGKDRIHHFDTMMKEMVGAKTEIFRANERLLIELIFRISKMLILRELSMDREYVTRLAKELINRSGARDNIVLRISSEDAETVEILKQGLMKSLGQLNNLNVEVSKSVKRGGCQVETEWNEIDASIEKQLESIYLALTGSQSGGDEAAATGSDLS